MILSNYNQCSTGLGVLNSLAEPSKKWFLFSQSCPVLSFNLPGGVSMFESEDHPDNEYPAQVNEPGVEYLPENDNGWVKIHRSLFSSKLWTSQKFTKSQAWIDLFGNANHKDGSFFIRGKEVIVLRGQIAWSQLTMAKRWRWNKRSVTRFMSGLESTHQITYQSDNVTTLITILNYDKYQSANEIMHTKVHTRVHTRVHTNKNDKNDKKIYILGNSAQKTDQAIKADKFVQPALNEVLDFFKAKDPGSTNSAAEKFWNFYEAKGWMVGKNKMKNWKAAVSGWILRSKEMAGDFHEKSKSMAFREIKA